MLTAYVLLDSSVSEMQSAGIWWFWREGKSQSSAWPGWWRATALRGGDRPNMSIVLRVSLDWRGSLRVSSLGRRRLRQLQSPHCQRVGSRNLAIKERSSSDSRLKAVGAFFLLKDLGAVLSVSLCVA